MKLHKVKTIYAIFVFLLSILFINLDKFIEYNLATESTLEGARLVGYLGIVSSLFVLIKSIYDTHKK